MEHIYQLRYGDYVEILDNVWLFNQEFNGLFCITKNDGRIKKIYMDPNSPIRGKFLYSGITYWKNIIILIPMTCSKIALFDLDVKEFQYIDIDRNRFLEGGICSIGYYRRNQYLYIFPADIKSIVKFDLDKMQLKYIDIGTEAQADIIKGPIFRNQYEVVGNKIYIPFVSGSGIAVYDLENDVFEVKVRDRIKNCSTISYKDGKFYIGSWNEKKIYIWDEKDDNVDENIINVTTDVDRIFNASLIQGDKLVLFPYHSMELIIYDIRHSWYAPFNIKVDMENNITCLGIKKSNYTAYFSGSNEIKIIKCVDNTVEITPLFKIDDNYNNHIIAKYLNDKEYMCVREREGFLNEMLDILKFL